MKWLPKPCPNLTKTDENDHIQRRSKIERDQSIQIMSLQNLYYCALGLDLLIINQSTCTLQSQRLRGAS